MEFKEQPRERFFSKRTLGKIILFGLLLFGSATVQTSFFPAVSIFPASPDLLLSAVIGIALFDGERTGAVCGTAAGLLAVALGGAGTAPLPVFYMLTGYFLGIFARVNFKKNLLSWLIYISLGSVARPMLSLLVIVVTEQGMNLFTAFTRIILPELLMTVAFSLPNYFLARLVVMPFQKKDEV